MMRKWFGNNWLSILRYGLALLIAIVAFWGFVILINESNWIGISALATLLLAFAAFWTISESRYRRKKDREKERKARSAEELCSWAEEALSLRYLPYNYHKEDIAKGFIGLTTKNMLMIIAAEIAGDAFIEPTKKAEEALTNYCNMIRDRVYQKERISPQRIETLSSELEGALYPLLTYLYVLRYWDYDYKRFLADATQNGKLKSKYQVCDLADAGTLDKQGEKNNEKSVAKTYGSLALALFSSALLVYNVSDGVWWLLLVIIGGLSALFSGSILLGALHWKREQIIKRASNLHIENIAWFLPVFTLGIGSLQLGFAWNRLLGFVLVGVAYFILGCGIGLNVWSVRKAKVSKHHTPSP